MEKRKGLRYYDVLLIIVVCLAVAGVVYVCILPAAQDYLKHTFNAMLAAVTSGYSLIGADLPSTLGIQGLNFLFYMNVIFTWVSIVAVVVFLVLIITTKYGRALTSWVSFLLSSAFAVFALSFYIVAIDPQSDKSKWGIFLFLVGVVATAVVICYGCALIGMIGAIKDAFAKRKEAKLLKQIEKANKKAILEEVAPQPEPEPEPVVEAPAPVQVEEKVIEREVLPEYVAKLTVGELIVDKVTVNHIYKTMECELSPVAKQPVQPQYTVINTVPAVAPAPVMVQPAPAPVAKAEPVKKEEPVVEKKVEAPAPAPVVEPAKAPIVIERVPFETKLKKADKDLKAKYKELSEHLTAYGLNGRISIDGDTYRLHTVKYCHITIAGKKMKVYYPLKASDFKDSPIPVKDCKKIKKYEDTPVELDVKSDLSLKRAKELVDLVMSKAKIEKK